jgi:ferredoxin
VEQVTTSILWLLGLVWFFGFGAFSGISWREGEIRAARVALGVTLSGTALIVLATFLPIGAETTLLVILASVGLLIFVAFNLPIGLVDIGIDIPQGQFDERDIMFSRAELQPGTPDYEAYYAMRPENKASDDRTRAKPGLLSMQARLANPYLFASPKGGFFLTEALREAVDGPVEDVSHDLPAKDLTRYLKDLALYYGACQAGVTELQPYHLYSHIGRGAGIYGEPVSLEHRYALAFTVEMDFHMVGASPNPQTAMESVKQYVEAARVAVQLAAVIRALGFEARAHIDKNYRLIAPLVARDTGLGEIGRMGLLMTPNLGPRVRLGAVTTNAELIPDGRQPDPTVIDFCNICQKCAENCPSKSIPFGERREVDGVLRWKVNSETCFHYWTVIGTDCGRCMAVCPYSHPDSTTHNLIRWGIARSGVFRRGALWMDDFFYGKHPASRQAPAWAQLPEH